jgi:hypothetical protein
MATVSSPPRAVYVAAVEALAGRVIGALTGADDTFWLAEQFSSADVTVGLAAVRVLGADALAPFVVAGHRFEPNDAEVVAASIRMFPTLSQISDLDESTVPVRALRDWATGQALARLGVTDLPGLTGPYPRWPGAEGVPGRGWLAWSGVLAQLSPLAFPGLDGPIHAQVRQHRLDVARGTTRALLRRDHLTAARLARWLATGPSSPTDPPLPVEPVLRHLELVADPDPRLLLEITMARCVLGGGLGA